MKATPVSAKLSRGLALTATALALLAPVALHAYGPTGHSLVGAIAQAQLSQTPSGQAALKKALALLADPADKQHPGFTLLVAGPVPDDLRTWDDLTKTTPPAEMLKRYPNVTQVPAVYSDFYKKSVTVGDDWPAAVRQQLWVYFATNCAPDQYEPSQPAHHVYHFADIGIADGANLLYAPNKVGATPHDIVHVIDYCNAVLSGQKSSGTTPPPSVTKTVALVLLVHLLGDIHQPLHVGSEYFDSKGNVIDPDHPPVKNDVLADAGGNFIHFRSTKLHSEWDSGYVDAAVQKWQKTLGLTPSKDKDADLAALAAKLAKTPGVPAPQFPTGATTLALAQTWANESIKLSQQAHDQLVFSNFQAGSSGKVIASVDATAKGKLTDYDTWAAETVQQQLVKGGLRLAWLIEHALK